MQPNHILEQLEKLVDQHGMAKVVSALATMCACKAAHVEENWQDSCLTARWAKLAAKLEDLIVFAEGVS